MPPRSKAPAPIVAPELAAFPVLGEGDTPTKAGAALRHAKADKRVEMLRKIPGGTPSAWARFAVDRLCDVAPAARLAAMSWLGSHRTVALLDAQRGLAHLDARWPEVEAVLRDPFGLYRRWGYEALAPQG